MSEEKRYLTEVGLVEKTAPVSNQRGLVHAIQRIHTERKSSVVMLDEIHHDLAQNADIQWFSVHCVNSSMLHPYPDAA